MPIQWFPGHMTKAFKQIRESLLKTDVVIEILDARIPHASRNPMIEEIVADKPSVVVLNKSDLGDPEVMTKWVDYFKSENKEAVQVSAVTGKNINGIIEKSRKLCKDEEWFKKRAVRVMIIGVPNVGKSAIVNYLAGKKKQDVSNRPGVTRNVKKIKLTDRLHLVDTPGVLWHKFEDQTVGEKLAILGSINDAILFREDIAIKGIEILVKYYPERFAERYKLKEGDIDKSSDELLTLVGRKRGCLVKGGIVDTDKASRIILTEIREGKLGGICLEVPE